jgi:hypothetical protein
MYVFTTSQVVETESGADKDAAYKAVYKLLPDESQKKMLIYDFGEIA